jgi:transposase
MPLSVRIYDCAACETVLLRDHNASPTILGLGRQVRVIPEAPPCRHGESSLPFESLQSYQENSNSPDHQ